MIVRDGQARVPVQTVDLHRMRSESYRLQVIMKHMHSNAFVMRAWGQAAFVNKQQRMGVRMQGYSHKCMPDTASARSKRGYANSSNHKPVPCTPGRGAHRLDGPPLGYRRLVPREV